MHSAEGRGQQAIAAHGKPDACLAVLADQDRGDHAEDGADQHKQPHIVQAVATGRQRKALERVDDRRGVVGRDGAPGHHAGEHQSHADVQNRADDQRGDDADGHVALWIAALLTGGGDGVEADVGEEDDGAAGEDAGEAIWHEWVVVRWMDE